MKKQILALAEIGIVYLAASIILDAALGSYKILLWPALAIAFVLFATMITQALWEPKDQNAENGRSARPIGPEDDLTRLEHLCRNALDRGDPTAEEILSERISALALAAAAQRLNQPESTLREMANQNPKLLHQQLRDEQLFNLVTTRPLVRKGATAAVDEYVTRIEECTK